MKAVYLTTDDIKEVKDRALANGGGVIVEPMEIPNVGTMAVVTDAGQAAIGAWQPSEFEGFGVLEEHGAPSWFELHTRDYDAAVRFYQKVFGWEIQVMGDSPEFRYTCRAEPPVNQAAWRSTEISSGPWERDCSPNALKIVWTCGRVVSLTGNGRVIPGPTRGGHRRVELPDGRRGWVPRAALSSDRAPRGATPRGDIAARVRGLLGIPYLWGGRTPLGFDCSGFTQQVLAEQGLSIPRDADAQFRGSQPLARGASPREGDLIFFRAPGEPVGHVGLGLGGGYYAHCRRIVRVSSVDPRNELYDNELAPQFAGWKRPRKKPKARRPAASRRGDST